MGQGAEGVGGTHHPVHAMRVLCLARDDLVRGNGLGIRAPRQGGLTVPAFIPSCLNQAHPCASSREESSDREHCGAPPQGASFAGAPLLSLSRHDRHVPHSLFFFLNRLFSQSVSEPFHHPIHPLVPRSQKETINHDDIVGAIGPRPFAAHKEYQEFIESIKPAVRYGYILLSRSS